MLEFVTADLLQCSNHQQCYSNIELEHLCKDTASRRDEMQVGWIEMLQAACPGGIEGSACVVKTFSSMPFAFP